MPEEYTTPSRKSTRVPVEVRAELTTAQGHRIEGTARDLSVQGLAMASDEGLPVGEACQVRLLLDGGLGTVTVQAQGTVVRSGHGTVAVELGAVHLDSMDHLRKLVLYNSANPVAIEREFDRHQGLLRTEP